MTVAVLQNAAALSYASVELRADKSYVETLVRKFPACLRFATEAHRNDVEVVCSAVAGDGLALEHASVEMKKNREVVMVAVVENVGALSLSDVSLQTDSGFKDEIIQELGRCLVVARST